MKNVLTATQNIPDEFRTREGEQDELEKKGMWENQLEAIRYTTMVHNKLREELGTDIVLARLDPQQRAFIIEHVKHAIALQKQIPDSNVGNRIFLTMITEVLMTVILHRNVERNTLIEIIGGVRQQQEEEFIGEPESILTRGMNKGKELLGKGGQQEGGGVQ